MLTSSGNLTHDAGILEKLSTEHKRFGLPTMPKLDNARATIIAAMISHAFISSCKSHEKFKKINEIIGKEDVIKLDEETINSNYMSIFYELAKISEAKHAAGNKICF